MRFIRFSVLAIALFLFSSGAFATVYSYGGMYFSAYVSNNASYSNATSCATLPNGHLESGGGNWTCYYNAVAACPNDAGSYMRITQSATSYPEKCPSDSAIPTWTSCGTFSVNSLFNCDGTLKPPPPMTCPAHQHLVVINGGYQQCIWDDTTCAGGVGWYESGGVCRPADQTVCDAAGGGIYDATGGGFCQPVNPSVDTCPWDTRFDASQNKCVYVGDISGVSNPDYPLCSPTVRTGACYPAEPNAPITSAPSFCSELQPTMDATIVCRNADGSQGAPPLLPPPDAGIGGVPLTYPPAQGGANTPYTACPNPINICATTSYSCLNEANNLTIIPACQQSPTGTDSGVPFGVSGDVAFGGTGTGSTAIGGNGGIGGGANGGSSPTTGAPTTNGSALVDPSAPTDPTGTPSADGTTPGTAGGAFDAGAKGGTDGTSKGYTAAKSTLCPDGKCYAGPNCDKDFCSASERINKMFGIDLEKKGKSDARGVQCPAPEFDLRQFGLGLHTMDYHCQLAETYKAVIQYIMQLMIFLSAILIVLDA